MHYLFTFSEDNYFPNKWKEYEELSHHFYDVIVSMSIKQTLANHECILQCWLRTFLMHVNALQTNSYELLKSDLLFPEKFKILKLEDQQYFSNKLLMQLFHACIFKLALFSFYKIRFPLHKQLLLNHLKPILKVAQLSHFCEILQCCYCPKLIPFL